MKESKDTDPGHEKKTQAGKDTQNSGKSTAQDDGSTAGHRLSGTVKCLRM